MTAQVKKSVAEAYRAGELPAFFRLRYDDTADALQTRRPDIDRAALAEALRTYHRDLGMLDAVTEAQLTRLAHPESLTVVTGQQAGVLTGPAYSVHKGAGAVLLADELSTEDRPALPIYWIASQDHDAAEVAGTTLLDLDERLHHLKLDLPEGVPVGRMSWKAAWTDQILALLDGFAAPAPHVERVRRMVRSAVAGEVGGDIGYADVFARLMHALLGPRGLLLLDPLHPAIAPLFVPALARELEAPLASSERIEAAAAELEEAGFEPQLRRPAGATNLFLEGEDGQRRLLRYDGQRFEADRSYSQAELQGILHADPSRLTPAAGLRPIIQDSALPTAAFVVGPGEIAYGAQLRGVYGLHGLEQPLLWPRLSVTWLEPNVARLLRRFGLTAAEFGRDPEGALGRSLARERGAADLGAAQLARAEAALNELHATIGALDPTLAGAVDRSRARTVGQVDRLRGLAARALARAENDRAGQLDRLNLHLLPLGTPQEREMNFLTYLLKHGPVVLDRLMALGAGARVELEIVDARGDGPGS